MICHPCREKKHHECPELARQADETLGKLEKLGGQLCDCHHVILPAPSEHDTDRIDC